MCYVLRKLEFSYLVKVFENRDVTSVDIEEILVNFDKNYIERHSKCSYF